MHPFGDHFTLLNIFNAWFFDTIPARRAAWCARVGVSKSKMEHVARLYGEIHDVLTGELKLPFSTGAGYRPDDLNRRVGTALTRSCFFRLARTWC